jgi:DNA-binding protein Fis
LECTDGNQDRAALLLGIARRTLRHMLRHLELQVTHSKEANEADLP